MKTSRFAALCKGVLFATVVAGALALSCSSNGASSGSGGTPLTGAGGLSATGGTNASAGSSAGGSNASGGSSSGGSNASGGSTADAASGQGGASNGSGGAGVGGASAGQGGAGTGGATSGTGGALPRDAAADTRGTGGTIITDASRSGMLKIMAVGDSITRATCWRALLWQHLTQSFAGRFDLVGTLNNDPGCGIAGFDGDNQGYSSSLLTEVVAGITNARTCDPICPTLSDFATAFATTKPDVVLLHYGTNDVWNAKPAAQIVSGYSALVDAARAANPNVVVLIAQIIPMNVTAATCAGCSCANCATDIPALNSQIATWAPTKTTAASPIVVVNQYAGFDAVADTRDGVHPNT
ncbi:MAG TPA: GDSL-type esterase/lipase family protein, partial [Polyangiaceae bacterium]